MSDFSEDSTNQIVPVLSRTNKQSNNNNNQLTTSLGSFNSNPQPTQHIPTQQNTPTSEPLQIRQVLNTNTHNNGNIHQQRILETERIDRQQQTSENKINKINNIKDNNDINKINKTNNDVNNGINNQQQQPTQDSLQPPPPPPQQQYLEPKTFISENEQFINIELELPGVKKETITRSFNDSILVITAPKNEVYPVFGGAPSLRNPKSKGVYRRILKIKLESIIPQSIIYDFHDSILFIRITKVPNFK